jgi:hypothetical protein
MNETELWMNLLPRILLNPSEALWEINEVQDIVCINLQKKRK